MTSSIFPPRSAFAPCSPSTQLIASTTLLLPEPFGPTTQVIPGSRRSVVAEAKDLKPFSVRLFRCTRRSPGLPLPVPRLGEGYRAGPTGSECSALDEAAEIALRVRPLLDDLPDGAWCAPAAQGREQRLARRPVSFGDDGHAAVGQ